MTHLTILLCIMTTFWVGLASSVVGAIFVVFFLFYLFRPRFRVLKEIAINDEGKLMFCFKNKSLFPCINIHVTVKQVKEHDNADESEAPLDLEDSKEAYMKGRFAQENESEIGVVTKNAVHSIPAHLRLIISAQHAVSGICAVNVHDFVANDAQDGKFEKGLFIPKGNDYGRIYTRKQLGATKITSWILAVVIVAFTILFGILWSASWIQTAICFILLMCTFGIALLLWLNFVQARVNAFSSQRINKINLLMLALEQKKSNLQDHAVDVEYEDSNKNNRRQRIRKR